jgi:hypothetical protein
VKHLLTVTLVLLATVAAADGQATSWQRTDAKATAGVMLFHSPHSINLPTAETLRHGNLEFEVSHRFYPFLKDGSKHLFGFDGPAVMRLALSFAATDRALITFGRSNLDDNLDLRVKYKVFQIGSSHLPAIVAFQGGSAWNPVDVPGRSNSDSRNFQFYAQGIVNVMIAKKIGLGFVPSYLSNSDVYSRGSENSWTIGANAQYYFMRGFSVLGEWSPVVSGYRDGHNAAAFGIELETGGHFFKIIVSNSVKLNPAQHLAGTPDSFEDGDLHFGFAITRLLELL